MRVFATLPILLAGMTAGCASDFDAEEDDASPRAEATATTNDPPMNVRRRIDFVGTPPTKVVLPSAEEKPPPSTY